MVLKEIHSRQGKLLTDDMWQNKLLTNDIEELRYDAEILLSEIEVAVGQEPDRALSFSKYLDKKFQQLQVEFAKLKDMMVKIEEKIKMRGRGEIESQAEAEESQKRRKTGQHPSQGW